MATSSYNAGTHTITLAPGKSILVELYGAGGGGGLGVHQNDQNKAGVNGSPGGDTSLLKGSNLIAVAGGGAGGQRGWWDNGSAWKAGDGGAGGEVIFDPSQDVHCIKSGNKGHQLRNDRIGGPSLAPSGNYGKGGDGGNGYGNHSPADGWAAGGGGGSYARTIYTNTTADTETLTIVVGSGGAQGAYGNYNKTPAPTAGMAGIAYVTPLDDVLKHVHVVRSGTIKSGQPLKITKTDREAHLKYSDTKKVAIFVSPEGQHEGWSVTRTDSQITIDVWNRSGTSRVGYSGDVNWVIIEVADAPSESGIVISGVANVGNFNVGAPRGLDLSDTNRYAMFVSPEGGHEGWSILRIGTGIDVNIWNRSGTGRVGYSGNISWMVVDMQANYATYPFIKTVTGATGSANVTSEGSAYEDTSKSCVLVCPQTSHEAWTTTRSQNKVVSTVNERSGTNRIGYSGLTYQMVLKATPELDPNVYGVGVNVLTLLPSQTVEIFAFGGGGGGGASIYTWSGGHINFPGGDGEDTVITVGSRKYTAGGGKGGGAGWWGNGSHYGADLTGGAGGTASVSNDDLPSRVEVIEYLNVTGNSKIYNNRSPQNWVSPTKVAPVVANNTGGGGAWGVGDGSLSGGTSGGTGAGIKLKITNNGSVSVPINVNVGGRGIGNTQRGNPGYDGGEGAAYVLASEVSAIKKKLLIADLIAGGENKGNASVEFMYTQDENNAIAIPDDYEKNHINLWDFFISKMGRQPNQDEEITFVIPQTRTFVAPFGYIASTRKAELEIPGNPEHKGYTYANEVTIPGHAAVSLKGWNKALNNKITVDIRGKAIGSFANGSRDSFFTPYDKATKQPITWATFKSMGWTDVLAAWWYVQYLCGKTNFLGTTVSTSLADNASLVYIAVTNPVKNPAFFSDVPCTLIVRQGGYVIGGGGNQVATGMYSREDIPDTSQTMNGATEDNTNVHAGDAIHLKGSNNLFKIENYGYISGGGGGGSSAGRETPGVAARVFAQGGLGAPLAGTNVVTFPLYIDLAYVKTLPVVLKTLSNDYTNIFDVSPDSTEPNPLPITSNLIEMSDARTIRAVDLSKAGINENEDNILDMDSVNYVIDTTNRLLSPTSGTQVTTANNQDSVISGSGGAPGINGQSATIVRAGSSWLNSVPNTPGNKGKMIVETGTANSVEINHYPGSVYVL